MAASNPVHASLALAWGSATILGGLPKISGRGGDEALEGPGSVEVVLLLPLSSGAALSGKRAALVPIGAAGVGEGASGVLVVLAIIGAAGGAPVDSSASFPVDCQCSGYRGISVHLLLGPFNDPASAQGWNDDRSPAEKTLMRRRLMRRCLMRRTTTKTAKDQKTSS
jgi:hypothetical protein